MAKEKIIRSLADLASLVKPEEKEQKPKEEVKVKEKKEKALYEAKDIRIRGTQLNTTDGMYETYSVGMYTSWRRTIIGQKNGTTDVGNNINDGYVHASFHDRNRAATILVEMITRYRNV